MDSYLLKLKKRKEKLELLIQKRNILLKSNASELLEELSLLNKKTELKKEIEMLEQQHAMQQKKWKKRKNKEWKDITIIPSKPLIFMFALLLHSRILFAVVILSLIAEVSIILGREIKQLLSCGKVFRIYRINGLLKEKEKELEIVKERLKEVQDSLKKIENNLEELNLKINNLTEELDFSQFIITTTTKEITQNQTLNIFVNDKIANCFINHPDLAHKLSLLELKELVMSNLLEHPDIQKMEEGIIKTTLNAIEESKEDCDNRKCQKKKVKQLGEDIKII